MSKKTKIKLTIAIPAYNSEKTIRESIQSALDQKYPNKEVLVVDNASTDRTAEIANSFEGVRFIVNSRNRGIGGNINALMADAKGRYIVYLCADDLFADENVCTDIVKIFDNNATIGVIGRYFYFFMDGKEGPIGVCRDKNILTQSCCPSGMAFRVTDVQTLNRIFVEVPTLVARYLPDWEWTMLEYDTIAARFHPGGNTGTKEEYYTESPIENWTYLVGKEFRFHEGMIQIKNRAPKMLFKEIKNIVRIDPLVLFEPKFWGYAFVAVLVPGSVLRKVTVWYRDKIARRSAKIIRRGE